MSVAVFVTNFADQAVMIPSAVAVGIGLSVAGWHRGALAWSGVIASTWVVILLLKLACLACGSLGVEGLHSPSGHTASAATAVGGFLGLAVRRAGGSWRWTVPISAGLAVTIGLSRLALHAHTPMDVLVAGVIGVLGAVALVRLAGPPPHRLRFSPVVAALAGLILLLHGSHAPAEAAIQRLAALGIWDELHIGGSAWQSCQSPAVPFDVGSVKADRSAFFAPPGLFDAALSTQAPPIADTQRPRSRFG